MKHSFQIYSPNGIETREFPLSYDKQQCLDGIIAELSGLAWYRIQYHLCRNETQQPCDPWTIEVEHGDVPEMETDL